MLIRTSIEAATRSFLRSKKDTLRAKSYAFYSDHLTNFSMWCIAHNPQIKYLEDIKAKSVEEYQGYLKRHNKSENTIHGAVQTIKIFLRWCSLDEEFEDEVSQRELQKIRVPKVHSEEISSFTDEEIEMILRAVEADRDPAIVARNKALVYLLLDTGARASEIVVDPERPNEQTGLRLQDLLISDPHDPRIKVMGKGGKPREVPVGVKTAKALRLYINRYRPETKKHPYVFIGRGEHPLTLSGFEHIFMNLSKGGQFHAHPHKFRHTFAVKYLLKTKDIYGLSRLMGHSSVKITERYLRTLSLQDIRKRGSIVDDM